MKNNKLFTLIELIVVIAILSILSILAFLSLNKRLVKSRNSVRLSDTNTISKALIVTAMEKGKVNYPIPSQEVPLENLSGEIIGYQGIFDEKVFEKVAANLSNLPKDPLGDYYGYTVLLKKSGFEVIALLEDDNLFGNKINQSLAETDYRIPYTLMYHDHLALPYKNIDIYSYTYNGQILTKNILGDNAKLTLNFNEIMEINVNHPLITGSYKAINILSFTGTNSNNILLTKFKPALPSPKGYYAISLYTPLYPLKDEDLKQIFSPEISKLATMFTGNDCNPENIVINTTGFTNGIINVDLSNNNYILEPNTIYKVSNGTYEVLYKFDFRGNTLLKKPKCTAIVGEDKYNTTFIPKINTFASMSNLSILSNVMIVGFNGSAGDVVLSVNNSVLHNSIIKNNTGSLGIGNYTILANNYIDNTPVVFNIPYKILIENNNFINIDVFGSRCYSNCEQYGYINFINNKFKNIGKFRFLNIGNTIFKDFVLENVDELSFKGIDMLLNNFSIISGQKIRFAGNNTTGENIAISSAVKSNDNTSTQYIIITNANNVYLKNLKIDNISGYNRLIEIQPSATNISFDGLQITNNILSGSSSKILHNMGSGIYINDLKIYNNSGYGYYIIDRGSIYKGTFKLKNIWISNEPNGEINIRNNVEMENLFIYNIRNFYIGYYYSKKYNVNINNCLFLNIDDKISLGEKFDSVNINNCIIQNIRKGLSLVGKKNIINNVHILNKYDRFNYSPLRMGTGYINNLFVYNYNGSLNSLSGKNISIYNKLYIFDSNDVNDNALINNLRTQLSNSVHPNTGWLPGQIITGNNMISCDRVINAWNGKRFLLNRNNNCSDRGFIENFTGIATQLFFGNKISNQVQPYKRSGDQLVPWGNWDPNKKIGQW